MARSYWTLLVLLLCVQTNVVYSQVSGPTAAPLLADESVLTPDPAIPAATATMAVVEPAVDESEEPGTTVAAPMDVVPPSTNSSAADDERPPWIEGQQSLLVPSAGLTRYGRVGTLSMSSTYAAGLAQHNFWRARHFTPPLTWDDQLASKASSWADKCKYKYDASLTTIGDNYWVGYAASPTNALASKAATASDALVLAVDSWYYQVMNFGFANTLAADKRQFAQLVWGATTKVGCAVKKCNSFYYAVCRYNIRANNLDGNNPNVLPRSTIEASHSLTTLITFLYAEGAAPSARYTTDPYFMCLKSKDWRCKLCLDFDGFIEIYYGATEGLFQRPAIYRGGKEAPSQAMHPFRLTLQTDGNLVVYDKNNLVIWATMTFGNVGVASMQNDCNFVVYKKIVTSPEILWQTGSKVPAG